MSFKGHICTYKQFFKKLGPIVNWALGFGVEIEPLLYFWVNVKLIFDAAGYIN